MAALPAEFETGEPARVPLVEGHSPHGLRTAISRAATSCGLTVGTVVGRCWKMRAGAVGQALR